MNIIDICPKKIQMEMSYMPHTDALVWVAFSEQ